MELTAINISNGLILIGMICSHYFMHRAFKFYKKEISNRDKMIELLFSKVTLLEKLKSEDDIITTEIVQKWPHDREEVKYRRTYGSKEAKALMKQVDSLPKDSGYFYRHV